MITVAGKKKKIKKPGNHRRQIVSRNVCNRNVQTKTELTDNINHSKTKSISKYNVFSLSHNFLMEVIETS